MSVVTGLLVKLGGRARIIPGDVAREVRRGSLVSRVPGSDLHMTLVRGRVVPVIALGESTDSLVLCEITGEVVGLLGLEVIASGFLDASSSGLTESQPPAEMLDVAALVATLRTKLRGRFAPPLPDGKRL